MKYFLRSTILAFLAGVIATPAMAQLYLGGSVGRTDHNMNRSDWTGGAGFSTNFDDSDSAYKLFAGYKFGPNFGLEGGYTDLGRYTATITGGGDVGNARVKTNSWNLFGVGTLPLGNNFSLFGKLGFARNESKMSFSSGGTGAPPPFLLTDGGSHSSTEFAWGLGASYAINRRLSVRLEYERFGDAGDTNNGFTTAGRTSNSDPNMWSIGLQVGF